MLKPEDKLRSQRVLLLTPVRAKLPDLRIAMDSPASASHVFSGVQGWQLHATEDSEDLIWVLILT